MKFIVDTDFPLALNSPDYVYPQGTKNVLGGPDYTWSNGYNPFVDETQEYFGKKNIKVLDLGAASGCLVDDFLIKGADAMGLEGSDWPIRNMRPNWQKYHNTRLFTCDLSKPFTVTRNNEPVKFDLICAWEVIEHLPPSELNTFAQNVYNHMDNDGIFCFSLSPWWEPSVHNSSINLHLSHEIKLKKDWKRIFNKFEFIGPISEKHDSGWHYIFKNRYRGKVREEEGKTHTFWSTLRKIL